ncbi:MAG: PAS domain S-box protein [Treponema sp.]|jgi:PAS domain S-box-containing protein|nr:PAS domain S-box protein [Treponema sp.]
MGEFYRRALKKIDKLTLHQSHELLFSASGEISRLETVLDSLHMGILVCDEKHNLVMVNKSARRLLPLNYTEGELWQAVRDERIVDFLKHTLLNSHRVTDREMEIVQQGCSRLLSINVVPLVHARKITGSLICIEDITEKRKGESRLRRAESLASLTTLAAGVAHEIKNPLGSISIHLQLLQKALAKNTASSLEKSTDRYFTVLKEEVDRLNRIVVDFLFAVRPMNLDLRKGDINELILQMVELVRVETDQSSIRCLLELDDKLPKILLDERYMKQALLNLIKNAQAAMPDGGLLTVATSHVENEIRISICDTGTGISAENISKIFEPYFTTKETGTGLGLTQVFKIIREHHGEIAVDSAPGEGTDFQITLPIPQKETRMIAYLTPSPQSEGSRPYNAVSEGGSK